MVIGMAENNGSSSCFHAIAVRICIPTLIVSLLGVTSNLLLLNAFIKDPLKCFRNSGSYLVIDLTVSDLLTCLIAPLYFRVNVESWTFVSGLMVLYFMIVSSETLVSVSIDRYLLVAGTH